jgi:hypothetical protein
MAGRRTNRTPKKGAPRKRSAPDWAPRFLAALAGCANIRAACAAAGVSRSAAYERRDSDKDFRAALRAALADACDE